MKSSVSTFRSSTGGVSALGRTNLHFVYPGVKVNGQYYRDIIAYERSSARLLSSTPIASHYNRMGPRHIGLAKLSNFWKSRRQTSFCNCTYTRTFIKCALANHIIWKQISYRIHWCKLHSNRSIFEKVIAKKQRGLDFKKHGVELHLEWVKQETS